MVSEYTVITVPSYQLFYLLVVSHFPYQQYFYPLKIKVCIQGKTVWKTLKKTFWTKKKKKIQYKLISKHYIIQKLIQNNTKNIQFNYFHQKMLHYVRCYYHYHYSLLVFAGMNFRKIFSQNYFQEHHSFVKSRNAAELVV